MGKITISIVKGKGSMTHNNRDFITENVDKDRVKDNVTYIKESLRDAYEKCFDRVIEDYNAKQKRSDRKIDGVKGYMEQVRTSGNGEKLFYENVVQVGNMQDCHVGTDQGEIAKEILDDYMQGFKERNPNLYVFNSVLHLDEQTPHLHIDYIPLADGYKQGLQIRNSLDRALKQQGVIGKSNKYQNRTIAWQNREKDHIEKLMNSRGLERSEDKGLKAEHKSVEYYKTVVSEINNEVDQLPKQIESKAALFDKDKVIVKKDDLEQLEHRANLSLVHEKATKKLIKDISKTKESGTQYVVNKMSMALLELSNAEKERDKACKERKQAEEMKEKYYEMYKEQEDLNDKYKELHADHQTQKEIINELQDENTLLKAQILDLRQSFDEKVQNIVEPLKNQIEALKTHLKRSIQNLTNVVKAVGLLKYDKGNGFKVELSKKQSHLIESLEKYSIAHIENNGKILDEEDDTVQSCKDEIGKKIGISKGIASFMEPDYPERVIFKGGEHGRGFYDKEKNFYGGLEILNDLKEQKIKIYDPQELLSGQEH